MVCDQLTRETGILLKSLGNIGWRDKQSAVLDRKCVSAGFIFFEKKDIGLHMPFVYCCRTAPTAVLDAAVITDVGASDLG